VAEEAEDEGFAALNKLKIPETASAKFVFP
jgi:hypothetical protein